MAFRSNPSIKNYQKVVFRKKYFSKAIKRWFIEKNSLVKLSKGGFYERNFRVFTIKKWFLGKKINKIKKIFFEICRKIPFRNHLLIVFVFLPGRLDVSGRENTEILIFKGFMKKIRCEKPPIDS